MSNPEKVMLSETVTLSDIERVVNAAIKVAIKPLERSIRYLNDSYGIVNEFIIDEKFVNDCTVNEFIIDEKLDNECIVDST